MITATGEASVILLDIIVIPPWLTRPMAKLHVTNATLHQRHHKQNGIEHYDLYVNNIEIVNQRIARI